MSSIRLFILGTLAASGPLHGHQIRHQAQSDRTEEWADVHVGSLYGALKRLANEGLVREVRTERVGHRPERTVYEITREGHRALAAVREQALRQLTLPNDPFDLALAQSRDLPEETLTQIVADRLAGLRVQETSLRHRAEAADIYLNEAERMIMRHIIERVAAEVRWHEELARPDAEDRRRLPRRDRRPGHPGGDPVTTSAGPDRATAAPAPAGHGWRAVSIVLVGAFMALLDTTIVNVALPSIRAGLHAPASSLEWIVAGYALAYGLALVPAGRAGDRFGHKPLFLIGLTVFTLASVACGVAQHPDQIVIARVVQGLGAGMFYPAISATIQLSFTGPARSRAFGVLGATIGVSTALGPLLGGLIIAAAGARDGWRWVFLVNLFIGVVTVPLAAWLLPRSPARGRRGFDPGGLALLTAALLLLLIPLVEGQQAAGPPGAGPASAGAPWLPRCWPPGKCARTGAAATRCCGPGCSGRCRSPPGPSSRWSTSPASPACSSRCRSCGRKASGTARWSPGWSSRRSRWAA